MKITSKIVTYTTHICDFKNIKKIFFCFYIIGYSAEKAVLQLYYKIF